MTKQFTTIALSLFLFGCSTVQLQNAAAIARPIADAALIAAASYYGLPPDSSRAAVAAFDSLWGAVAQVQAGQPAAHGAVSPSVGNAIQGALPIGTGTDQTAALLEAAAKLVKK
jgi:hypothetical protein